ncbi:MAG: hypothetical protein H7305_11720 [Gemmatimonadaceae bacterium]|nr:hypothetical protein [Gemmatimonadaceae bacterium]
MLVIGGGAAGLSLGRRVAQSRSRRSVLILEGRDDYSDDRTWSFWSDATHDLRHMVRQEWRLWRFDDGASPRDHGVPGQTYQTIRGLDFCNDARHVIERPGSVELQLGVRVSGLRAVHSDACGSRVAVETNAGPLVARHVIDTRPQSGPALLFQCFAGAEVNHGGLLAHPHDVAGLMTRMRADEHGFAFTYVLPFTATTALVEFTRFSRRALSPSQLAQERDAELCALGLGMSRVVREEHGVLPMGSYGDPAAVPAGVVIAGNGGGAIRPSTGYAFMRIQRWALDCASRLARGAAPVGHPRDGVVQRQLDRIFLQVLRETPERTPEYFMALASRVSPERLLRFLTDRATPLDMAALVASLPIVPFLKQLPASGADVAADSSQSGAARSHPVTAARLRVSSAAHAR